MHIAFFSHYFPPEGNAPASRTYEHCVRWVRAGHRVTVITCAPNVPNGIVYPGYRNRLWPQRQSVDGIDVIRVWTYVAANAGGLKRILNFVSYWISSLFAFLFWCRRPDIVIATSPQFFCGWAGVFASWLKWRPFLLEIRDIWPESIMTVGAMKKGFAIRILEILERWMYASANYIVAVGEGYKANILAKVDVSSRIGVVTNGVDLNLFAPQPRSSEFRRRCGLADEFVCSYVGTIGMAHGLDVVLRAAESLRAMGREDIRFCLIGDGAERENLQRQAESSGLDRWVRFTGRLDKSQMATAIASSDCLLVHLKGCELFESVIPSKIFEAMSMSRPIVMGVRGESAAIVRAAGCGLEMTPDDERELVQAVCQLKDHPATYERLCLNGRDFVARKYSRDGLAEKYLRIIECVAQRRPVPEFESPASVSELPREPVS